MSKPASTEHGATLDLKTAAQELCAEEPYAREGHTARTLFRAPDLRIILVALRTGQAISEHHASVTAVVQVLSGRIGVQLGDRAVALEVGQMLALSPGLAHDVHAQTDATFLLTLGWPTNK